MNREREIERRKLIEDGTDEIKELLEKIVRLQKRAVREELEEETCDKDHLGSKKCEEELNTRPVTFYTREDKEWEFPIRKKDSGCCEDDKKSCVFRVEKIEGNTAICRILEDKECRRRDNDNNEENDDNRDYRIDNRRDDKKRFKTTESFFFIKLRDIAAVRCLEDTCVDIL